MYKTGFEVKINFSKGIILAQANINCNFIKVPMSGRFDMTNVQFRQTVIYLLHGKY